MLDPQILTIFYPVAAKAKVNAKQVLELLLGPSLAAAPALRSYLRMCVIASNGLPLHRGRYQIVHNNFTPKEYFKFSQLLYWLTFYMM